MQVFKETPKEILDQDLPRPCGSCRLTWTGVCYRDHAGLVALPGQACVTETTRVLSPYLDRRVCYRDLVGLVALPGQACVLPRPCGSCRLTWTGVCYRDHAGLVALLGQACVTETTRVLSPYLDRRVCYRDLVGLVALPGQAFVTETLWVLSPYLDRTVCCMRCCSSRSQGTGCRRAARPGCRRSGSGTCCRFHRSDCTCPTLPKSPTHRPLKDNGVLSLPSSPLQQSALVSVTKLHLLFFAVFRYAAVQTSWELRPDCKTIGVLRTLVREAQNYPKLKHFPTHVVC